MNLKQHPPNVTPTRAGHSIGRWEGDVLVVDTVGFLPGILVDAVVEAAFGAHPAAFPGHYPVDEAHLRRYIEAAQSDEGFAAYLEETVYRLTGHGEYVERFVPADWRRGVLPQFAQAVGE